MATKKKGALKELSLDDIGKVVIAYNDQLKELLEDKAVAEGKLRMRMIEEEKNVLRIGDRRILLAHKIQVLGAGK